jgi:hypothetical protein
MGVAKYNKLIVLNLMLLIKPPSTSFYAIFCLIPVFFKSTPTPQYSSYLLCKLRSALLTKFF